jgi:DedD protein
MAEPVIPQGEKQERQRARRRLIGAITIAALLAVFLPMVFDSEPPAPQANLSLTIPAKDSAPPLSMPLEPATRAVGKPAASDSQTAAKSPPEPAIVNNPVPAPAPVAAVVTPAPVPAVVTTPPAVPAPVVAPPAAPAKAAANPEKSPLTGFAVQLGAFRDAKRIEELKKRLAELKINYFLERRVTAEGELVRMRAGPFKSREEADKALRRLTANGLTGKVVSLP